MVTEIYHKMFIYVYYGLHIIQAEIVNKIYLQLLKAKIKIILKCFF